MMIKFALTLGLISSTFCVPSFAEASADASSANGAVMIEIDGRKLTFTDVEKERPGVFFHAINTFYQGEQKALEQFVDELLQDALAADRPELSNPAALISALVRQFATAAA